MIAIFIIMQFVCIIFLVKEVMYLTSDNQELWKSINELIDVNFELRKKNRTRNKEI